MTQRRDDGVTRREVLVGIGAAGVAALGVGCEKGAGTMSQDQRIQTARTRMPVVFLPHGGGPWPWVDVGFPKADNDALAAYLREVQALPKTAPKALLVISAHWEEAVPTVMTSPRPPMLYDYYGFPPESYTITWPAPGEPAIAARVQELLGKAGIATATNAERGFDHGTFVPLKLAYPEANIPTVQLSLKVGLDPEEHLAIGRALAPLRDEGVFIIGSGMSYHNMRGFRDRSLHPSSETFDAWLREAATGDPADRDRKLAHWDEAPAARACHPREEHLIPLMVIAGAAGADRGTVPYNGSMGGVRISAIHYG